MISYYLSGSNIIDIRTQNKCSGSLIWKLQNMSTLQNQSASLSGYDYQKYESLLSFTASITSASLGDQYRAELINNGTTIWHGSVQVFLSESQNKYDYVNQIPLDGEYISNLSSNEYIILD